MAYTRAEKRAALANNDGDTRELRRGILRDYPFPRQRQAKGLGCSAFTWAFYHYVFFIPPLHGGQMGAREADERTGF